jgi:hypothetical protein
MQPSSTGIPDGHWSEQTERVTVQILAWVLGIALTGVGIIGLLTWEPTGIESLMLVSGLVVLPPVRTGIAIWTGVRLRGGTVAIVFVFWLAVWLLMAYILSGAAGLMIGTVPPVWE